MKKIHYAWIICIAGAVLIFLTMGCVANNFSIYLPYIKTTYGFSESQASTLVTMRSFASFIAIFVLNKYYEKLNMRLGMALSATFAAIGFIINSLSTTYIGFAIGTGIAGFAYGLGGMVPVSIMMSKWFEKSRSFATGICMAGSGVAAIVMSPLITKMILAHDVNWAFRLVGLCILGLSVILFFVYRNDPADMGLKPYGMDEPNLSAKAEAKACVDCDADVDGKACADAPAGGTGANQASSGTVAAQTSGSAATSQTSGGISTNQASSGTVAKNCSSGTKTLNSTAKIRIPDTNINNYKPEFTKSLWIIMLFAALMMGSLSNPGYAHMPTLYKSVGNDSMFTAFLISITGTLLMLGKMVCGKLADKIGALKAIVIFTSILLGGNILCCFAWLKIDALSVITAVVAGTGYAVATMSLPLWTNYMFTKEKYGKSLKNFQLAYAGGALLFSSSPGVLADIFGGSYVPAYINFCIQCILSLVFVVWGFKKYENLKAENLA